MDVKPASTALCLHEGGGPEDEAGTARVRGRRETGFSMTSLNFPPKKPGLETFQGHELTNPFTV